MCQNKVEVRKRRLRRNDKKKRELNPLEMLLALLFIDTQPQDPRNVSASWSLGHLFRFSFFGYLHSEVKFAVVIGGSRDLSCCDPRIA